MSAPDSDPGRKRYYFVDEAGDPVLFTRKGRINVGCPGCSKFFILGLADVRDPEAFTQDLEALRAQLLADPYFRGVPSFDPQRRRTAVQFHAKDDPPEVRREVFRLILKQEVRFSAVVKDKLKTVEYVWSRNDVDATYYFGPYVALCMT